MAKKVKNLKLSDEVMLKGDGGKTLSVKNRAGAVTKSYDGTADVDLTAADLGITDIYVPKGSITVAAANEGVPGIEVGWTYNVSDSGTINNGTGGNPFKVKAGDNIVWVTEKRTVEGEVQEVGYWDALTSASVSGKSPIYVDDANKVEISLDRATREDGVNVASRTLGQIIEYLGGTTDNITAFEVHPGPAIAAGTVDPDTGITYTNAVDAGYVQKFEFNMSKDINECDVVVDWGDGNKLTVKGATVDASTTDGVYFYEADDNDEWRVRVVHSYAETEARYIAKIIGDDAVRVRANQDGDNLVSKVFVDNQISDTLNSMSSFCMYAPRLLKVDASAIDWGKLGLRITNAASMLSRCTNLVTVVGMEDFLDSIAETNKHFADMFLNDASLVSSDCRMPVGIATNPSVDGGEMYMGCTKLATAVENLFPREAWAAGTLPKINGAFSGCAAITGTIPSVYFWDATGLQWSAADLDGIFGPASEPRPSAAFCAQVPATAFYESTTQTWKSVMDATR